MKERILTLRSEGKSYNEIKNILGCSKGTISYYCGDKQDEKAKLRQRANRANVKSKVNRKIEFFLRNSVNGFKREVKSREVNSLMSNDEAYQKIINNPFCYLTGRKIDLEDMKSYQLDHILPRSKGGSNELENLGLTCRDANQSKTDLTVEEYIALCAEVLEHSGYKVIKK